LAASSIALKQPEMPLAHELKGHVGMWCLIAAESAIFTIFVVAYLFYAGKSLTGPYPNEVLHVPVFNSICLFASSFTIVMAERALRRNAVKVFGIWWLFTIVLGFIFLVGTAREWYQLIYHDGLTISSNLFGTTFYSLVGLHASHVIIGLTGLTIIMVLTALGYVTHEHERRIGVFALYWHFVDAIWVVVLSVVYFIAK
jgi:cytochrome c oxidase subunit 3/cytochrome o ubiquinol oxidase subunit 3